MLLLKLLPLLVMCIQAPAVAKDLPNDASEKYLIVSNAIEILIKCRMFKQLPNNRFQACINGNSSSSWSSWSSKDESNCDNGTTKTVTMVMEAPILTMAITIIDTILGIMVHLTMAMAIMAIIDIIIIDGIRA